MAPTDPNAARAHPAPAATLQALVRMVLEHSGVEVSDDAVNRPLSAIGLDSLFLTQFSVLVSRRFGVPLTYRKLSTEVPTLVGLAEFIDAAAPGRDGQAAPASPAPVAAGRRDARRTTDGIVPPRRDASAAVSTDELVALFASQIALMQRQLDVVAGALGRSAPVGPAQPEDAGTRPRPSETTASSEPATVPTVPASPPLRPAASRPRVQEGAALFDANRPPVRGARLGRDRDGKPAWFVPSPGRPGHYVQLVQDAVDDTSIR
jgi:hypothetical protein